MKSSEHVDKTHMRGTIFPQIFYLGPSFCFMKCGKYSCKNDKKFPLF